MDKVPASHINRLVETLEFKFEQVGDSTTTVCYAFLPNGFRVGHGDSACVDPDNYNWDEGCKWAKSNAIKDATSKLWMLEGYMLKMTGCISGVETEAAFKTPACPLTFGDAIHAMKNGCKVARKGWNGKGMWLRLYSPFLDKQFPMREIEPCEGTPIDWISMKTADNSFVPWLASQTDMLAEDWVVI